ncbi:hypothetical protein Tco_0577635 [Tanacetum coccineum]
MMVTSSTKQGKVQQSTDTPNNTPTIIPTSPSQPQMNQRSRSKEKGHKEDSTSSVLVTRFENVFKTSNDSLLVVVNTPQSNEDRLKLNELMEFCTKLQQIVLDLENTKTAQAQEITSLKLRVKKLEKKGGSRTHKLKRLYKVGRSARVISCDKASLGVLDGDKVLAELEVTIKDVNLSVDEVTLEKVNVVEEPKEQATTPTVSSQQQSHVKAQDKGKGIMVEEPVKKKKKDQISLDEELDFKLQAKEEEEERLVKEKSQREEEANNVEWDNVRDSTKEHSKRAGEALEQESSKKQKLEEDKESEELKQCLEIIPDDEDDVKLRATPLSLLISKHCLTTRSTKRGRRRFPIIRADEVFKARFKKTEPVNYMDNFLLLNLKTMFKHHVEDNNILYYLLVEKMYPLTNHTLHQMFNDVKLQVDYECEMAFELLILVKK